MDAHTVEGKALAGLGRHRDALARLQIGLGIGEKALGVDNAALARPLAEIGAAQLALGDAAAAIDTLERALKLRKAMSSDSQGELAFLLANAIVKAGKDRDRALALALTARAAFVRIPSRASDLAEVDAWIATLATRP